MVDQPSARSALGYCLVNRVVIPILLLTAFAVATWLVWANTDGGEDGAGTYLPRTVEEGTRSSDPTPSAPPSWAKVTDEQTAQAAKRGAPVAFKNTLGMRFVLIPAGTFLMGSPEDEKGRRADEAQHEVTLTRPYYMQMTEMTNAQYRRCPEWLQGTREHDSGEYRGRSLNEERQPAVCVSWEKATELATWLSREDGDRRYALPTEAQWEFACRAGTSTCFWWGDSRRDGWNYANANDSRIAGSPSKGDGWRGDDAYRVSAPAAFYRPNAWGLHDMAGNVWEWCADRYGAYRIEDASDPTGPRAGPARVLRGGSWIFSPMLARSATRVRDRPHARSVNVGFRFVCAMPEKAE